MKIGTDVCDINRIKKINKNDRLAKRILSKQELKDYFLLNNKKYQLEYLAGRLSAKESIVKASNKKIIIYNEINIQLKNDCLNIYYKNKLLNNITLSISHERNIAIAICLIE